jgi:hypothetical protein
LRWVSLMVLTTIPWIGRVWALPFLTVLAPSERYHRERRMQHKKITDWVRQMIRQVRRWLPERKLVVVMDSSYAVLALLGTCVGLRQPVTVVTRLRLDAALYDPAPVRQPRQRGAPRKKGARQPSLAQRIGDPATAWQPVSVQWYAHRPRTVALATGTAVWYHPGLPVVPLRWVLVRDRGPSGRGQFATQALLCTDLTASPAQIVEWFVLRWQLEVTFQETLSIWRVFHKSRKALPSLYGGVFFVWARERGRLAGRKSAGRGAKASQKQAAAPSGGRGRRPAANQAVQSGWMSGVTDGFKRRRVA